MRRSLIGKRGRDSPSSFANLAVHLLEHRLGSKHPAVTNVDSVGVIEHFTFADVARETGRWAHLLRLTGLQPGDRVLVVAGREWSWRCALLGVLRAGGVAVPCPASLDLEEIRAIGASADARHLISISARPDLAEAEGLVVLNAEEVEAIDASRASQEPAHESLADDLALILCARRADDLRGVMHTHASLIAQADAGAHWLGVGENEPVWCTAEDGSPESIWLLLAGWHEGANIVNVDLDLDPDAMLELLGRLGTAAVWFSDDEYARLASASPAAWINGSINRALLSDERSSGATAFANAVGADVAAVFGLAELGVVAGWPPGADGGDTTETARPVPGIELAVVGDQGTRLPAGLVGEVVVRGEAPSLLAGYAGSEDGVPQRDGWIRFGWRGALAADGALRLASRSPAELERVDAEAEAEERRQREEEEARKLVAAAVAAAAAEGERARREAAEADERRRAEEQQREEERRRAEQEAQEREQAEAKARAEREAAAAAEERRRAEEEQRRQEERRRDEEARRLAALEASAQADAAAQAEREAANAEKRRRAEEAERARRESAAAEKREREQAETERRAQRAATARGGPDRKTARTKDRGRGKKAQPRRGPPRLWVWQLLSLLLLLVIGALLGAYFLTRPDHEAALSRKGPHVTARKQGDRGAAAGRPLSGPAKPASGNGTKTTRAAPRVYVPSTVGLSKAAASRKLEAAGFSVYVKYVTSQRARREAVSQRALELGRVVGQTPVGETPVKNGKKVLLMVSLGR